MKKTQRLTKRERKAKYGKGRGLAERFKPAGYGPVGPVDENGMQPIRLHEEGRVVTASEAKVMLDALAKTNPGGVEAALEAFGALMDAGLVAVVPDGDPQAHSAETDTP